MPKIFGFTDSFDILVKGMENAFKRKPEHFVYMNTI